MIRCLVVDDEPLVRKLMEDNIRQVASLHLVRTCKSAGDAAQVLRAQEVDLMFLDVHMPELNGLQLLESLEKPPLVILVTAYEQYALRGYDLEAVDYLLKPFSFARFLTACRRAQSLLELKRSKAEPAKSEAYFFVNVEYTHVKVIIADINYIEGLKDYVKIHLASSAKPVLTRMTMKSLESRLPPGTFLRTHKSFIVALDKITTIKRDTVCVGQKEIPVSDSCKEHIRRLVYPFIAP